MERDRSLWTLNDREKALLEAAPEMLETLKMVKIMIDEKWNDMSNAQTLINNAIQKRREKNDYTRIEGIKNDY